MQYENNGEILFRTTLPFCRTHFTSQKKRTTLETADLGFDLFFGIKQDGKSQVELNKKEIKVIGPS